MSVYTALTLPGVDVPTWTVRTHSDPAALALADRHYSRETRGANQMGGPGHKIVLVTPCERAVWVTRRHADGCATPRSVADRYPLNTYRCGMFRNEGAGLSSALILSAMELTERLWGHPPSGWQTYVDARRVRSSNPGYCFRAAGWVADGWRGSKLSLIHGGVT